MIFTIIFYSGIILYLLVTYFIFFCASKNRKMKETVKQKSFLTFYKWRYAVAVILVSGMFIRYPIYTGDEWFQIYGFPLMAATFDSKGTDFVSAFTGIFVILNAILWYFSIHIFLCLFATLTKVHKGS